MTLEQIFLRLTDAADRGVEIFVKKANVEETEEVETPKIKVDLESGEAIIGQETETPAEYGTNNEEEEEN